ncbi:MAG: hypothetical protein DHS20C11_08790 [Lysobacteraceae bacterium]|nr:MAG: hypothetical protein DHS20C11_08790 [Xanthomonadaceae bacterium]
MTEIKIDDEQPKPDNSAERWGFLRDLAVFQVKLLMDWIRDLLLSPISLIAALVGTVLHPDRPGQYFYEVLRLGKRSERWINLFGARRSGMRADRGADELFAKLEKIVVEQHARGGMTASAKTAIDKAFDAVHEQVAKRRPVGEDEPSQ